ncbi:hypothetical protein [Peterkaempfera bronchialis]|uniref:AAA+ ATPase domain-containing protein n=1 Tax=Peterkaempfera bronchialis TaxID=2126346 RepID=A0A345T470_9ACTN|nr:hypothetical protein [Peterkaempfera bronchialis]AXI80775.1 hypothetical protein C7M71_028740 [Peterkaempfera bronchialis]
MSLNRTLVRGRDLARTAGDHAADMLGPLVVLGRGLLHHTTWVRAWWKRTPGDRRGPALLLAAAVAAAVAVLPYGLLLAAAGLAASAAWAGRDRAPAEPAPDATHLKLQAVYAALTPYLGHPDDPKPLYAHDGDHTAAFTAWEFDAEGRLTMLELRYPPYFRDSEAASRTRVEQVLQGKAGRSREYRFIWDEEINRLRTEALAPLPDDITVQRFVTGPGELVLGVTDPDGSDRTIPLNQGGTPAHQPPVVWRTGARASDAHLLALGTPRSGTSTLLRALALQALPYGDIVVIDGAGTGEHGCLVGRPGVRRVETSLHGAVAALQWAAGETARRLAALERVRLGGGALPKSVTRPLWLLLDHPTELSELAHAEGRPDPQDLLEAPLRQGRAVRVCVVVAEHLGALDRIRPVVRAAARGRVVLGSPTPEQAEAALGAPLDITPPARTPPGRGYARLGGAAPVRLQVPAAPDPLDEDAPAGQRDAVIALLPHSDTRVEAAATTTTLVKSPAQPGPGA